MNIASPSSSVPTRRGRSRPPIAASRGIRFWASSAGSSSLGQRLSGLRVDVQHPALGIEDHNALAEAVQQGLGEGGEDRRSGRVVIRHGRVYGSG